MKKFIGLILVLCLGITLVACSTPAKAPVADAPAEAPAEQPADEPAASEPLNLFASFHDPTLPWGQPAKTACDDFAKEYGVNVQFIGPTPPDAVRQLEQVKTLVEQNQVDGLAIAPLEDATLRPYIDEMIDKDIPVVTFVTDSPDSKRLAFYGQDFDSLEKIAYELSKKTIELLDEPKGKVAILNCLPDLESLIMRENGSKRAIAEYPDLELIGTFANKTDFAQSYADVEALLTANPDIVALFAQDSFTTPSAAKVLRDLNLSDQIALSGYDMTEEAILLVRDGHLDILVGQNPYMQAYLALKGLYDFIVDGIQPVTTEVEAEFATIDNIAEFLKAYNVDPNATLEE